MTASAPIAIVGAGRMGRGIALAFAYAGLPALIIDLKPRDAGQRAALAADIQREITADLDTLRELEVIDGSQADGIAARIRFAPAAAFDGLTVDAEVVFEAVPEVMAVKREAMAWMDAHFAAGTPLASTTSTFTVTELAALTARPADFLNAHWLNPAHIMPLVELSLHAGTAAGTLARVRGLLERIGKVPVTCKAAPGYIVPRLQTLLMNEAARMVEEGVASAEEIDKATRYGLGFRFASLGVAEFIDFGGSDILYYASRYLTETLGNERYASPPIVAGLMERGELGFKSGRGLSDYAGADLPALRRDILRRTLRMLDFTGLSRPPGSALPPA